MAARFLCSICLLYLLSLTVEGAKKESSKDTIVFSDWHTRGAEECNCNWKGKSSRCFTDDDCYFLSLSAHFVSYTLISGYNESFYNECRL